MDKFLKLDPSNIDKLKRSQDAKKVKEQKETKTTKIWIEKYRPKSLDEIVSQEHVIKSLKKTVETGKMQHLLFYGPPGTGKTSAILALSRELYGGEYRKRILELNASDERGIQVIREKVKNFAQKIVSKIEGKTPIADFQIIILDEADLLTNDAQSALRRIIEDNSVQTRFCIICNYLSKIIDPIVSRCATYRFNSLAKDSQINHLKNISQKENIQIPEEIIKKIQKVSKGDLRKSINLLQTISKLNTKMLTEELIDEVCGIIPEDIIINFLENCRNSNTNRLLRISKDFIDTGYSFNMFINQLGNYVASDDCKLEEKLKNKIFNLLYKSELDILNGGSPEILCLELAKVISDILKSSKKTA